MIYYVDHFIQNFISVMLAPIYFHINQSFFLSDYAVLFFNIIEILCLFILAFMFIGSIELLRNLILYTLSFSIYKNFPFNFFFLPLTNLSKKFWSLLKLIFKKY